jgi:peroxiredoxin Q/BCP
MPVELRKRKTAPPPPPPAKKAARGSKTASKPAPKPATKAAPKPAPKAAPKAKAPAKEKASEAPASTNGAATGAGAPAVGDIITLDGFGGEIETNDGEKTTLKALVDESKAGVAIFTYPKASTPGCKTLNSLLPPPLSPSPSPTPPYVPR